MGDERSDRVRLTIGGDTVEGITPERLEQIRSGLAPTSLEYALIAEASGRTVDWLLHGEEREYLPDNSAEAWEEDWDDSPQLGGMGEELRQEYQ